MVIQDIQEVAQFIEVKLKISLQWMDARVLYYNIKPDEKMNSLTLDEQLDLWTPTITKNQLRTVNDKNTFGSIRREGNGSMIEKEVNEDIEVYTGSENFITISRVYSIKYFCEYDMRWYPFDQQICTIDMVLDGVLDNYAQLVPGQLKFSGAKELTQYFVRSFKISKRNINNKGALKRGSTQK